MTALQLLNLPHCGFVIPALESFQAGPLPKLGVFLPEDHLAGASAPAFFRVGVSFCVLMIFNVAVLSYRKWKDSVGVIGNVPKRIWQG